MEYFRKEYGAPERKKIDAATWIRIGLLSLLGLAGALLVGGVIWFFVTFTSIDIQGKNIHILYPRGWRVDRPAQADVVAGFVSPKENALDQFAENVVLSTYDMSRDPLTTEKYVEVMIKQMNAVFSNIRLVDKGYFLVAGRSGYRLVFRVDEAVPKIIVVYAFTIEDTGYNMLYMGAEDRYPKDRPLTDMMALMLRAKY